MLEVATDIDGSDSESEKYYSGTDTRRREDVHGPGSITVRYFRGALCIMQNKRGVCFYAKHRAGSPEGDAPE